MPRDRILQALKLVRSSLSDASIPRKESAKLGMIISSAAESCLPKTMRGERPDLVSDYGSAKAMLDCVKRASDKLLEAMDHASSREASKIFDQLVVLSSVMERLRFVASRIRRSAYGKGIELKCDQRYYKGRFLIALYEGEDLIGIYRNSQEASEGTNIKITVMRAALRYAYRGDRSFIWINGRKCRVYFVPAFD